MSDDAINSILEKYRDWLEYGTYDPHVTAEQAAAQQLRQYIDKEMWNLWEDLCKIETVTIMLPVDYTPNSQDIEIPRTDKLGLAHTVVTLPIEYVEQVFQNHSSFNKLREPK